MSGVLAGRVAIVTGASRGLGLAIARAFVDSGASLCLCARDVGPLDAARLELTHRATAGQRVIAVPADVSSPDDVGRLMSEALDTFGRVHVLVSNAGVYGPMGSIESVEWDSWVRAVQINLFGPVLMCRAVLPHFREHRYGKIIQIAGGGWNALPGLSAYVAAKAGIVRVIDALATEVGQYGVDINAVAPGGLNTRLLDEVLDAGPDKVGEEFYRRALVQKANGGTPVERGAELAVYLASSSSDGISGKLISAVWDPWVTLHDHIADLARTDVYTMRRIVPQDRGLSWGDK